MQNQYEDTAPAQQLAANVVKALNAPTNDRPAKGCWAPGNYVCLCTTCQKQFIGDKRAMECSDCAYSIDSPVEQPSTTSKCWTPVTMGRKGGTSRSAAKLAALARAREARAILVANRKAANVVPNHVGQAACQGAQVQLNVSNIQQVIESAKETSC